MKCVWTNVSATYILRFVVFIGAVMDDKENCFFRAMNEIFHANEESDITDNDILRIADLARISVPSDKMGEFRHDIGLMVSFIKSLQKITNLDKSSESAECCRMRKDEVTSAVSVEDLFANAPCSQSDFFVVPGAIEDR